MASRFQVDHDEFRAFWLGRSGLEVSDPLAEWEDGEAWIGSKSLVLVFHALSSDDAQAALGKFGRLGGDRLLRVVLCVKSRGAETEEQLQSAKKLVGKDVLVKRITRGWEDVSDDHAERLLRYFLEGRHLEEKVPNDVVVRSLLIPGFERGLLMIRLALEVVKTALTSPSGMPPIDTSTLLDPLERLLELGLLSEDVEKSVSVAISAVASRDQNSTARLAEAIDTLREQVKGLRHAPEAGP